MQGRNESLDGDNVKWCKLNIVPFDTSLGPVKEGTNKEESDFSHAETNQADVEFLQ